VVPFAVRRASPYRIMPPSSEREPEPRACRASRARLTPSRGALAASLAAHAAVLGALALAAVPPADVPPEKPQGDGQGRYVHVETHHSAFPLSPWVRACFDRNELRDEDEYLLPESARPQYEPFDYRGGAPDGWARLDAPYFGRYSQDGAMMVYTAGDCAQHASQAGWSGSGSVFVRVERREDGAAIAMAIPRSEDARHDALLCCLRQAQEPLAWMLRPGGAVRFVLVFDHDPERAYMTIESAATSRGSGGPAALAALRRGFSD
jgi:hypothetical protein